MLQALLDLHHSNTLRWIRLPYFFRGSLSYHSVRMAHRGHPLIPENANEIFLASSDLPRDDFSVKWTSWRWKLPDRKIPIIRRTSRQNVFLTELIGLHKASRQRNVITLHNLQHLNLLSKQLKRKRMLHRIHYCSSKRNKFLPEKKSSGERQSASPLPSDVTMSLTSSTHTVSHYPPQNLQSVQ